MNVFKSLITVLATGVLLLEVGRWSRSEVCAIDILNVKESNIISHSAADLAQGVVCYMPVSRTISVYVPYIETYRTSIWGLYRIKTRQNYRKEYRTVHISTTVCCEGYRQVGTKCEPHCTVPCKKGVCIKPDLCRCNAGYQATNSTNCEPVCTNGCINGVCVEPDICNCNEGYWMGADGITCLPICADECERNHGFCSEPHVCSCRPGYRKANDDSVNKCEPVCERPCTNGHCAAPDVCYCADGYEQDKFDPNFTCTPRCSAGCVLGTCTAPEICTCDRGYRPANASVCEPICSEPCRMGVCVAPESCSCNDGYGLVPGSKYVCEPICEFDCSNGRCTAPGVCTCDEGFYYDGDAETRCKPHCEIPCGPHGECTSPNTCTCFDGYRADSSIASSIPGYSTNVSICQPVCDFECINARCSAPNVCTCKDGYGHEDAAGHCALLCAETCTNDKCIDSCTCNSSYESRNQSGCEPICGRGCENGDCVAPDRCVCRDGFAKNTGNDSAAECIPACSRNCSGHGVCVIEDEYSCECSLGWRGENCEEPTVCVVRMGLNHSDIDRISNETSDATARTLADAPRCHHQCDSFLGNNSLCYYVVRSDEADAATPAVECLLSTDSPCYTTLRVTPRYNASSDGIKIVWPVTSVAVLIAIGLAAAAYLMYRKQQRNRLAAGNSMARLVRDSSVNESLICANSTFT